MMKRRPSRLLPFADKMAVLVLIFLLLALGVAAHRTTTRATPHAPLHPILVTLTQDSPGPLGLEKLVHVKVDKAHFIDEPQLFPKDLREHTIVAPESHPATTAPRAGILDAAFGWPPAFPSHPATRKNTGLQAGTLVDAPRVSGPCHAVLKAPTSGYLSKWDLPSVARPRRP